MIKEKISAIVLFKSALSTLKTNKQVHYPFLWLVFIQFLLLQILFFAPRNPLSDFFGPIIARLWGEGYLHYPMNLILLPKLFYYTQLIVYFFIGSYLLAIISRLVVDIEEARTVSVKETSKVLLPLYVHILIATFIGFFIFHALVFCYGLLIERALRIRSTTGVFYLVKSTIIYGAPYIQLLVGIFISAIFAYVVPSIVINKNKISTAIRDNFRLLSKSFWLTCSVVFLSSLFYLPVLIMRNNTNVLVEWFSPDFQVITIAISIVMTAVVNSLTILMTTILYLYSQKRT